MEDQIQFTNIFKTLIQGLHKNLGNKEKQIKKQEHIHIFINVTFESKGGQSRYYLPYDKSQNKPKNYQL